MYLFMVYPCVFSYMICEFYVYFVYGGHMNVYCDMRMVCLRVICAWYNLCVYVFMCLICMYMCLVHSVSAVLYI